jgi:parvulin-like peptidyl-prolyl isomerase
LTSNLPNKSKPNQPKALARTNKLTSIIGIDNLNIVQLFYSLKKNKPHTYSMNKKLLHFGQLFVFASFFAGTFAFAHSGHTHEEKIRISLPSIVAKVNGEDISNHSILIQLKKTLKGYKKRGLPLTIEEEKITAKKLIDNEIKRTLLLQKGNAIGSKITDKTVEKKLKKIKASFKSNAVFEHELKNRKLTLGQYKKELKVDILMQEVIDREIIPGIKITDEDTKLYYEKNKNQFRMGQRARASVILIKAKRDDMKSEAAARKKINSILKEISSGASFREMAIKHSEDSLAAKGGDLGYFTKDQMFGAFSSRAFDMKVNAVSPMFKSGLGFHILKLTALKKGQVISLDNAKVQIEKVLIKNKVGSATRSYVENLKKKADIKTYF